jgi:hypothetical protein
VERCVEDMPLRRVDEPHREMPTAGIQRAP